MQLIYTHPNPMLVGQVRSYLESHSIPTELKNDFLQGGVGELAPIDLWQEVWLDTPFFSLRTAVHLVQ